MKNKRILLSIGIILLLSLYIVVRDWKCGSIIPSTGEWKGEPTEVILQKTSGVIILKQRDGRWFIGEKEYPADSGEVSGIIKKVKDLEIIDRISSGGNYTIYDLGPDKAFVLTLKRDGEQVCKLLIGKKSSTYRHTYMRINDSPDVVLVSGSFDREISKTVDELRDKTVINPVREKIDSMDVSFRGRNFLFTKVKESVEKTDKAPETKTDQGTKPAPAGWTLKGYENKKIKNDAVQSLVSALAPLKAWGFVDSDKSGLKNPLCTVKIREDNRETVISVYQQDKDKRYPVTSSDSPYVFLAEEWKVKKFMIEKTDEYIEK